jgi:iron complex outermembrane recepter protein
MANKTRILAIAVASACSTVSINVVAQTTTGTPPAKVERIEVTGSNIKRVDAETSAPIQVITAEDIRRSGKQTVTELLRELPINATGGLTELSGSNSFSAGAATVSLRGLGSAATLVLLNGRRIAPFGPPDPNFGQGGVVNLNAIPIDAIDRIEILKDGASAVYGSEAIAGVVNIILRKDYKGGQVGATATGNKSGLYQSQTATASIGKGDLAKDRFNVFANFEAYRQDSTTLRQADDFINRQEYRDASFTGVPSSSFSPQLTLITNATGAVVPTAGATCPTTNVISSAVFLGVPGTMCVYDIWPRIEIVPKARRASVFTRGTFDISDKTSIFAEFSYVAQNTYYLGNAITLGNGVTAPTVNQLTGAINPSPTLLPIGHPNNPFARATSFRGRLDAVGFRDTEVENKTTRAVAGFKTVLGSWDVESGLLYNKNKVDWFIYNQARYDMLIRGITGNGFNFANPTSGSVTADMIRINTKDVAESSFAIWDFKASGEVGQLSGGAVSAAVGTEFRRETRNATPDRNTQIGNTFGQGAASADGSRNVSTVFGELVLPVFKNVEVQAAVRYDRYSDYGNSLTPKLAASWVPISGLKLRGSASSGFRAPSLTEASKSSTTSFTTVNDPLRCRPASAPTVTAGCNQSIGSFIEANPNLQPEKARTYSAGFVWEVSSNANLSVDYFSISRRNEVSILSATDVLNNENSTNPLYANRVVRDRTIVAVNPSLPNDPGTLILLRRGFYNNGETTVRGIDIDARYRMSLGEHGRLSFGLNTTTYTDYRGSGVSGEPQISSLGFYNTPRWRGQFRTTWENGDWTSSSAVNYVGRFKSYFNPENFLPGSSTIALINTCGDRANATYLGACAVKEYITLDLSTEYRGFKNWRISASVRNATNERPPFDPRVRPLNLNWYPPQGMNFALGARYSWN